MQYDVKTVAQGHTSKLLRLATTLPDVGKFHEIDTDVDSFSNKIAWDDLTGMKLHAGKVTEARGKEIECIKDKGVWTKIPRQMAIAKGWKIVKTRWIDINKGNGENPVYRSRLVGKEFNDGDMDGIFAGTPPLEALRYLVHEAATVEQAKGRHNKVIMINDVARAFFEAKAMRTVCVELPEEGRTQEDRREDMVGLLKMSLYGTRDAATNWQNEVAKEMVKWGFRRGRYNPCLYWHKELKIRTLVHGDDFVSVGDKESVIKFKQRLEERFEIKTRILGSSAGEEKEGRVLNRVIRVTANGWEYEPDQRHVDIIVEAMGLKEGKGVLTQTEDEKVWEEKANDEELDAEKATQFRKIGARANYLAADRPDIMYSVKEICRQMSRPTLGGWKRLKRLARYLLVRPRTILKYHWQMREGEAEGFSDSDWAGCRRSGKSTSGGVIKIGEHFIKGWSKTQASVTLSSAEAELVAMCKLAAEMIGLGSLAMDLGNDMKVTMYADSSAAIAIAKRKGAGKLRHINIGLLWIQEKTEAEEIVIKKVKGVSNPSDMMTKGVNKETLDKYMSMIKQKVEEGRAREGLKVKEGKQDCIGSQMK